MYRPLVLVPLVLLIAAPLLWSDEKKTDKPTVEQLIEKLGDADFQVRKEAAQQIEALGVEALPALLKARDHKDAEIRRKVNEWIPALEKAAVVLPKKVSIDIDNRPIREAILQLEQQTGYKIIVPKDSERDKQLHTIKLEKVPFWEAFDIWFCRTNTSSWECVFFNCTPPSLSCTYRRLVGIPFCRPTRR